MNLSQHVFYHADREASLKENQDIGLDENHLSRFGNLYWPAIGTKTFDEMTDAEQREFHLERFRREPEYHLYASRLESIFAANSVHEAIIFANSIQPRPDHPIPIIEIYAERFWTLDSVWLDFVNNNACLDNYRCYWDGRITNHCPQDGERHPPLLEVMIALPARTGKIVWIEPVPS